MMLFVSVQLGFVSVQLGFVFVQLGFRRRAMRLMAVGFEWKMCWVLWQFVNIQSVPRSKHTSQLMLYREIIAVCSEIHTNAL